MRAIADLEEDKFISLISSSWINIITLFDHEEVGSESAQGANSMILPSTLRRIYDVMAKEETEQIADGYNIAISKSFQISADMAHSVHPNYGLKHQENHQIKINQGLGIKVNVNQNYATDCISASILAQLSPFPTQQFIVKNDSPCGSTIGRFVSAQTGVKTIDVGAPMLSMHSIRETCGVKDTAETYQLFVKFLQDFQKVHHDLMGK